MGGIDLLEDLIEAFGEAPARIMALHVAQVADGAEVITHARLVDREPRHLLATESGDAVEGFQDGDAIGPAAAEIVDFADARLRGKGLNEARHVEGMDVVPHLLALVTVDFVQSAFDVALDEVTEEAVQLDTAVIGAGETAAA